MLNRMCMSDGSLELLLALESGHTDSAMMASANHHTVEHFVHNLGWIVQVLGLNSPPASLFKVTVLGDGKDFVAEANIALEVEGLRIQVEVGDL